MSAWKRRYVSKIHVNYRAKEEREWMITNMTEGNPVRIIMTFAVPLLTGMVSVCIVSYCFLCYNRASKTTGEKYLREYQRQGEVIK